MDFSQQEEFSYAFVHAITAAAGYSYTQASRMLDIIDVDAVIHQNGAKGKAKFSPLYLQVKSSSQNLVQQDNIYYDLEVADYNALSSEEEFSNPFILVVVLVPKDQTDWIVQSQQELCLKDCAYWLFLGGNKPTNNTTQIRIHIPRSQQLTVSSLQGIMKRIRSGAKP
jgi:hypothetical protein